MSKPSVDTCLHGLYIARCTLGVRTSFLSDPWNKRESTRGMVEGFVVTSEIRVVSSLGDERGGSKRFINGDLFVKISSNPSLPIPLSSACNARDTRTGIRSDESEEYFKSS